jgi:hypothetical protein
MLNRRATGIRKLQAEVKEKDEEIASLKQQIAELKEQRAEKTGDEDWGETLKILVQDIDTEQIAKTIYDVDPDAAAKLRAALAPAWPPQWPTEFYGINASDQISRCVEMAYNSNPEQRQMAADLLFRVMLANSLHTSDITITLPDEDEEAEPSAAEIVWVVIRDLNPDDYMVFLEKDDAQNYTEDYNDSAGDAGNASLHAEPSTNFDFTRCKIVDGELVRGRNHDQPPKRVGTAEIVWVDEDEDEDEAAIQTLVSKLADAWVCNEALRKENLELRRYAPPASPAVASSKPKKRRRNTHFGGEPDHDTWVKINVLLRRLEGGRLDNTTLITRLIDEEFSNPTNPPPRGDNRPPRGDHFGAYPSPETWIKINQLRGRWHIDNTELIQWLVGQEYGSLA